MNGGREISGALSLVLPKESVPGPPKGNALWAIDRRKICTDLPRYNPALQSLSGIRGCLKFRAFRFACTPWAIIRPRDVGDAVPYRVVRKCGQRLVFSAQRPELTARKRPRSETRGFGGSDVYPPGIHTSEQHQTQVTPYPFVRIAPKALFSLESEGFLFGKHKKKPLRRPAGAAGEKITSRRTNNGLTLC